ncbi:MAG: VWA domain-containing protein [Hyphomicrobiales bacterium]|nr:VWA domain-containing protein [Hyphomicrobiales bacterium]
MPLTRFLKDRRAGVAPMLALTVIPLIGAVGAAVDYSRANAARTAMQAALDSTALMLSKDAQTLSSAQLTQKATTYFNALFQRPEVTNVQVTQQFTTPQQGNFSLTVLGTGTLNTIFWKLIGQSQVDITATGEVVWGIKKLNLALALDNTGSMSWSGKMTALKEAAHNLLNTLQKAERTPGDIRVAIVPFAVDVDVGTDNVNATWIDWSDWESKNGTCSKSGHNNQSSCNAHGGTWTPHNHSLWNGCVMDRDQNNDVNATPTGDSAAVKYRAHQASACPTSMMPLSTDWTALNTKIDAMTPTGNTNVTIGLQMAWQTLTAAAPFNAPAPAPDLDKVIILLTDGQNTQNRWTSSTSAIDSRTQKVCDNAKAANIKIYTVRVIEGNAGLLQACASKPDMYFNVQQASQLNSVFSAIAQNLANLRISK